MVADDEGGSGFDGGVRGRNLRFARFFNVLKATVQNDNHLIGQGERGRNIRPDPLRVAPGQTGSRRRRVPGFHVKTTAGFNGHMDITQEGQGNTIHLDNVWCVGQRIVCARAYSGYTGLGQ